MILNRERVGRVLVVHMLREDKRNAVNTELARAIDDALNELDDDPELWAGVITGTPKVFCAGTDLSEGVSPSTERGGEYGIIRRVRSKPLIAAVEGYALGGGFEIALTCDMVVAASTARFGLPEVKRGTIASSGGMFRATRALPPNVARALLLVGEPVDAAYLERFGVVNVVTEPGGALAAAVDIAERICANGPVAVRETLRVLRAMERDREAAGWRETAEAVQVVHASEDRKEGIAAFFERRPPQWRAR
jgi:enoyl-CoA hydratase/carnithine racemase